MAISIRIPEVEISPNARPMPVIGMGTSAYPAVDPNTIKLKILEAIQVGYRHFDTSFVYGSEKPLGEAIIEALNQGLVKSRDEFFITSKLWCSFADPDLVLPAIKMSLKNLQLDYLDLYLIHWPIKLSPEATKRPFPENFIFPVDLKPVWTGMEECQRLGLTKSIGVSNFSPKRLQDLLQFALIPPAVNQVEMNPMWQQKKLREFCKSRGIHITAYSPLGAINTGWGDDRILGCNLLQEIANSRGKTVAQVSLRWAYEQGVSMVPKSFNKNRMQENLQIFGWSLTDEEIAKISNLPQRKGVLLSDVLGPHYLVKEIDNEA